MPGALVFPSGRADRSEGAQSVQAPPSASNLNVRFWTYRIGVSVVNTRTIIVSPPFNGPALLREWNCTISQAATVDATLGLYWSDDNGQQGVNQAPTVRPSGTPILDPITFLTPQKTFNVEDSACLDMTDIGGAVVFTPSFRLNYYIPRTGQFFLKVVLRNGAAGTHDSKGMICIVENAPRDLIAGF